MTQATMPPTAASAAEVPFAIRDRAFIPRERYYDKTFFELENEKLWPHAWQMACRLEEIPRVGDYVEYWVPFNGDFGFHDASWQTMPFGWH